MGFDTVRFVSKVSEDRKCSLCRLVLDNPVKTPCSHVFCSGCILPWVVKHGHCPFKCQSLNTGDLDNVLALRELIINMKVQCEFTENGCNCELRLRDLITHVKECSCRPAMCRNKGCGAKVLQKDRARHEVHECDFRPVGICKDGCDAILLYADSNSHNCINSLKARVTEHELHVQKLESESARLRDQYRLREKELLAKIACLQKRFQMQNLKFANQLRDYESLLEPGNNNTCNNECGTDQTMTLVLERATGTLGFNIMGGLTPENSNNNNNNNREGMLTEGIIVSKVMVGGPAFVRGLQTHDQIVKICSKHFIDGRPTKDNPIPTVHMGYDNISTPKPRRQLVRQPVLPASSITSTVNNADCEFSNEVFTATKASESDIVTASMAETEECATTCCQLYPHLCCYVPVKVTTEASTQTENIVKIDHPYAFDKTTKNESTQISTPEFSINDISSDTDARFYSGLNFEVLMSLITMLTPFGKKMSYKLSIDDQILSILMRLRLGLNFQDIGRRFNISRQLASSIFNTWIDIMAAELTDCIGWLPRESIRRALPSSFNEMYPNTTCIIDCTEVPIQRPFSLKARNQTYSNYKSRNTAKFLVCIAPDGFIMFVSKAYGGRASDNFITKNSGFLNYLLPGDEIMADRGFTIGEEMCSRRVRLNIPAFMKGRSQLSAQEQIESKRIASVRIHVERAINRLKCYRILNTTVNIKSVRHMDKTMRVIAALCNLQGSLIKDDISE